jgi:hypothetical protein
VNDPLVNIEWLAEYCKMRIDKKDFPFVNIHLYKVIDKEEYIFSISILSQIESYYSINYFNCSGEIVFHWFTGTPPSDSYDEFFSNKEYVSELFLLTNK